jgi:predicted nucleic acid-binding protein
LLLRRRPTDEIEARLFAPRESLHAPHLLDVEVAQALRRYVAQDEISTARGWSSIDLLGRLPITRYAHDSLLERIWSLRHNLTACDAAYVALAEALGATLVTQDERLAAAPGNRAKIELVS